MLVTYAHTHGLPRGVPGDYLLFQVGETAQVHSGGYLKATPHMVRGCTVPGVSRSTMAVFLEPGHAEGMAMPDSRYMSMVHRGMSRPPLIPCVACCCMWFRARRVFAPTHVSIYL